MQAQHTENVIAQITCPTGTWKAYAQLDFVEYEFTPADSTLPTATVTLTICESSDNPTTKEIKLLIQADHGSEPSSNHDVEGHQEIKKKLNETYAKAEEGTHKGATYKALLCVMSQA